MGFFENLFSQNLKTEAILLLKTGEWLQTAFSVIKLSLKTIQPNVLAQTHCPPQAICYQGKPEPHHGWHVAPSLIIGTFCVPAVRGQGLLLLVLYWPKLNQHDLNAEELTGLDMVLSCRWEPMQQTFLICYLGKSKAAFKIWLTCLWANTWVLEGDHCPFRRHRQQKTLLMKPQS